MIHTYRGCCQLSAVNGYNEHLLVICSGLLHCNQSGHKSSFQILPYVCYPVILFHFLICCSVCVSVSYLCCIAFKYRGVKMQQWHRKYFCTKTIPNIKRKEFNLFLNGCGQKVDWLWVGLCSKHQTKWNIFVWM